MFKIGTKVIYPKYGAGKITSINKESINGETSEYYEVEFFHSQISVLVPVESSEELGLRKNYTKKELQKALTDLGKSIKISDKVISNLDAITKEKLKSGEVADAIELVNIIQAHSKKREKKNKKISFTESKNLESAMKFISSVTETVLGKKAVQKYDLEII